jgi:LPXTG-motif cell wall-anchored protein
MKTMRRITAAAAGAAAILALTGTANAASFSNSVDITVLLNYDNVEANARALSNTATVGAGSELDETHEVSNPEEFGGAVSVDIDPDADTITVTWSEQDNCYTYIELTITSAEMSGVELVSDFLFDGQSPGATVVSDGTDGTVSVLWGAKDDSGCYSGAIGNQAVFSFGQPEVTTTTAAPETTVAPETTLVAELPATGSGSSNSTGLLVALIAVALGSGAVVAARRPLSR